MHRPPSFAAPSAGTLRRADIPKAATPQRRAPGASAVLRAVLDHGPVARSTVARLTGLSPASVTGHCAAFVERGLLREAPETAGPRGLGRPHVPVEIDTDRVLTAGVHIAVAQTTLSLMDLRGRVVAEERRPHPPGASSPDVVAALAERLPGFLAGPAAGGRGVAGVGVATGHRVDAGTGVIVEHPVLGWQDVRVAERIAEATGLTVRVDSHARALLRAERLFGDVGTRERARRSAVLLFVGAVVDAAFVTGGCVHRGPRSGAGGVAHLPVGPADTAEPCTCGTAGCLAAQVSARAVLRRAAARGLRVPSQRALVDSALAGDPRALGVLTERARTVGRAAALLLDMFDPEVLVVVEHGVGALPACLDALREAAAERSTVRIDRERAVVPGSFTGRVLATAGAAVALDALYEDPPAWANALRGV